MENNDQKNPELQASESNEPKGQVIGQAAGQSGTSIRSDIAHYGFIMLICALMIGIYHVSFNKKPQQNIAVVDLSDIVAVKQKQFTTLLTKKNVTDTDRGAAYEMVKAFGPSLQKSLIEVQKDCSCTLVSKQAVLAGNLEDKTADLKAKLGMK
jgi:hypothetical protein